MEYTGRQFAKLPSSSNTWKRIPRMDREISASPPQRWFPNILHFSPPAIAFLPANNSPSQFKVQALWTKLFQRHMEISTMLVNGLLQFSAEIFPAFSN